jgi:hypothetical protein
MLVRVAELGQSAFQLRKGEQGISVFDLERTVPPLSEFEVLTSFRSGSHAIMRSVTEVMAKGLRVVPVLGSEALPTRLREAHCEIRPAIGMTRAEFKRVLRELE